MVDGKPAWTENEPDCHARVSGYGGSALGHAITVVSRAPTVRGPGQLARERRRDAARRAAKRERLPL